MPHPRRLATASLLAILLSIALPGPADALVINQNVNFAAVNRNPWTGGAAFESEWHLSQPSVGPVTVDLPKLNGNPINIIADFLGIDLPFSANVGVGGTVTGSAGFDFGYYVTGGKLNVNYPALSTINIGTTEPMGNRVLAGRPVQVGSTFTPGLNAVSPPLTPQYVALAGAGYEVLNQDLSAGTTMSSPFLKTTFPYASAWADFGYDIRGGAFVEATAKVLGQCIVCARKEVKFGDARNVTLLEIDPGTGGQPPSVYFLGNKVDPFQPIQVGPAKISFAYPDVAVQGALQGDRSVFGSDTKSIISVQGGAEKLIPFIGPFLANGVGPIGYQLMSTDGGPTLGLYQDFRFTPDPEVQLAFSQPVLQLGSDGKYRATNLVRFDAGQSLDIIAPLTLGGTELRVQPTYFLNNTVYNETGLSLGVQMDIEMLRLNSPLGSLGPAFDDRLQFELARAKLFSDDFSLTLAAIRGRAFDLDVALPVDLGVNRFEFAGAQETRTEGQYAVALRDLETGTVTVILVDGVEIGFEGGEGPLSQQKILLTGDDVIFNGANLGRAFCLACLDAEPFLFGEENPSLMVGDDLLFLTDLHEFDDGVIDISNHPILAMNNYRDVHNPVPTEIGPTVFTVPEPAALALFAAGLLGLGMTRRRARA